VPKDDNRGRVSLTVRERDRVRLSSADGTDIEVLVTRDRGDGRLGLSIEAPRDIRIERVPRGD
jgi:hypothetical protein